MNKPLFGSNKVPLIDDYSKYNVKVDNAKFIDNYKNKLSKREKNYQKLRWSYERQMYLGFYMSKRYVNFDKVKTWADVGCGTGEYFKFILDEGYKIETCLGIDPVETFLNECHTINEDYKEKIKTSVKNIQDINPEDDGVYDFVSCSGVLQIIDIDKIEEIFKKMTSLVKPGGEFWLNTLNFGYKTVKERRKQGLWRYKPEELAQFLFDCSFIKIEASAYNSKLNNVVDEEGQYVYVYGVKK